MIDLSSFLFKVCSNTSSTYQSFSLNSPLISSIILTPQVNFTKNVPISSTNPLQIQTGNTLKITVNFPLKYQIMEIIFDTNRKIQNASTTTDQSTSPVNAQNIQSSSNTVFRYLTNAIPLAAQQFTITIVFTGYTNITSFTINACTGKVDKTFSRTNFIFLFVF